MSASSVPSFDTFEDGLEFLERMGRDDIKSDALTTEEQPKPYLVDDAAIIDSVADCYINGKPYKYMGVKIVYAKIQVDVERDTYESDDGC